MKTGLVVIAVAAIMALGFGLRKAGNAGVGSKTIKTLGVDEFAKVIAKDGVRLIDVRTPREYADGHIEGAENIDVKSPDFAERIKGMKGDVAVYCVKGMRSMKAANRLAAQGCMVYNLDGGITAWKQAGKPVVR